MATTLGTATLQLTTDNAGLKSGLAEGRATAEEETGGLVSSVKEQMLGLGEVIAGVFALDKIKDFVEEGVSGAESLQKSGEVISSTFGPAADQVKQFGENAASGFGLSASSADAASAKFGTLYQSLGAGKQTAADMTIGWQQLAASYALAHDEDPTTMINATTLAAEGNSRGLKQLGIDLTTTQKNQEAMNLGWGDAYSKLTPLQQSTVTYQLAMQSLPAYLDLAKQHMSDLSDQQVVLKANTSNVSDSLGGKLLPALTDVTHGLNEFLDWVSNGQSAIAHLDDVMDDLGVSAETQAQVIKDLGTVWTDVQHAWSDAINVMEAFWSQFGGAIKSTVENDFGAVKTEIQGVLDVIEGIFDVFKGLFTGNWGEMWDGVKEVFTGVWDIIEGEAEETWNAIKLAATVAWGLIKDALTKPIQSAEAALSSAWSSIESAAERAWSSVKSDLSSLASDIESALSGVATAITHTASTALSDAEKIGTDIITGVVNGIQSLMKGLEGAVANIESQVKAGMSDAGTLLKDAGEAVISGLISGVESKLGDLKSSLESVAKDIVSWKGPPEADAVLLTPAGQSIMQGLQDGFEQGLPDVMKSLEGVTSSIKTSMANAGPAIDAAAKVLGMNATMQIVEGAGDTGPFANLNTPWSSALQQQMALTQDSSVVTDAQALLGAKATQGIVDQFLGKQPTMAQQLKQMLVSAEQQADQQAAQEIQAAKSAFVTAFSTLAGSALTSFQTAAGAYKSPAQVLLDKMQLQDQVAQYQAAVDAGSKAIAADQAAINAAAAAGDLTAQQAAQAQLLTDQASYQAAERAQQEFNLGQQATADTAAHTATEASQSTHLTALLTDLQGGLPKQLQEWVKSHTDIEGDTATFSAAQFLTHDTMLSTLLDKVKASLGAHNPIWISTYDDILKTVTSYEKPLQDAGKSNADAHAAGLQSGHDDNINAVNQILNDAHDAITNYQDQFKDAGNKIGDSLAEGLKEATASSVTEAAGKLAQTVLDFFPQSPAKRGPLMNLPKWENWLLPGLTAAIPNVREQAGLVAAAVASPGGVAGGSSGSDGGDVVLQVDGQTFARIARKQLANVSRRNGIRVGQLV